MTNVLITGANKGLGRETARQLAGRGWTVFLGARDAERGKTAATELSEGGADVRFVQLDVTSSESVEAAVAAVEAQVDHLDALINNAGIAGGESNLLETRPEDFLACFGVNLLGPVRATRAFLPLLSRADVPRVVMVSSALGSLTRASDADRPESGYAMLVYPSSKAALNMVTVKYAQALPNWKINAVEPGYTATDLNGHTGYKTVEQGATAIVAAATLGPDGPTGTYFDDAGPVPW
jgi:NAD(P)-dependent dehydrogenase (short-subunit alcohol dehydrogenase family)